MSHSAHTWFVKDVIENLGLISLTDAKMDPESRQRELEKEKFLLKLLVIFIFIMAFIIAFFFFKIGGGMGTFMF